jgi:purine nucleosidase
MRPVIFDTDIGSDVDDILALAVLVNSPELQLIGITTVYGDTVRRAQITKAALHSLKRPDVTVVVGEQKTLTDRQIYWAGHEGYGIAGLEKFEVPASVAAVPYLLENIARHKGELEILATGPLTNIAKAILQDRETFSGVKHLYLMGGAFWMNRPEHNIRCDPEAAKVVFESGVPITAIGLDLTLRVLLDEDDVRAIGQADGPAGPMLEDQIRRYWEYKQIKGNHPHDPLAALAMVRPELFVFETWDVVVTSEGRSEGLTRLAKQKSGNVRVGFDVLARTAEREIVRRISGSSKP